MLIGSLWIDSISDFQGLKDLRFTQTHYCHPYESSRSKINQSHKKLRWGLPSECGKHLFYSSFFLSLPSWKAWESENGMGGEVQGPCVCPENSAANKRYGNNPKRKPFSRPFNRSRWDPTKKASTLGKSSLFTNGSGRGASILAVQHLSALLKQRS